MTRCGVEFETARVQKVKRVCVLEEGHTGGHLSRKSARNVRQKESMTLGHAVGAIRALNLFPGDVLVVEMTRKITSEQAEYIKEMVEVVVGDYPVLILSPEMKASTRPADSL